MACAGYFSELTKLSALTTALPEKVVASWRKHLGTNEGQFGIDWLRRNGPMARGTTATEVVESAFRWAGYQAALDDIEDRLTAVAVSDKSLDEPPLELPSMR